MTRDTRAAFAAIDSFNPDNFVAHLTEDVVFRFGNAEPLVGRAAVRGGVAQFFNSVAGLRHDVLALYENGDVVVAKIDVVYTRHDGKVVVTPNADILTYDGDLVREWLIYIDLTPVFA